MEKDYSVKTADGNVNYNKYINTLDYSLDLIQLREAYTKKYRNDNFSFKNPNKKSNLTDKEYTPHVVNVTFKYSYKLYNKCNKNVFVKDGYSIRDIILIDCVYIKDNELIAIEVGREVASNQLEGVECKYFEFNNEKKIYEQKVNIKTLMNVKQLREHLYLHGFTIDGIKYRRWKRSSGSARVGKCLFINEDLYNYMHKWDFGLKIKNGQDIDLAAFEGAVSLSLSSIFT